MRVLGVTATILLLTSLTAAASSVDVEPNPGIVKPGSPLYGFDLRWDRLSKSQGGIAFERASELHWAIQNNQSQEVNRTQELLNTAAEKADRNSRTGLQKAESVLQRVRNRTDDSHGLSKALESVRAAQNREPMRQDSFGFGGNNSEQGETPIPDLGGRHENSERGRTAGR